jgi:lysophospholipase L1-like esterase
MKSWIKIGSYVLLGLLTLEVAARIEDALRFQAPLLGAYSINTVFEPSPYGRSGRPGARYAKWSFNSLGYRGPEPAPDRANLLAFGASETFGLYERPDGEYPRLLEQRLNAVHGARYNVINIAVPGISIGRVDYLDHALQLSAAKVVLVYPAPANYIGHVGAYCGQRATPVPTELGLTDQVRLAGKLSQLFKAHMPEALMTRLRRFSIWLDTRHLTVIGRVPDATLDAYRRDLECVVAHVRQHGAEPILLTHASYFHGTAGPEDMALLSAWRRFYPQLAEMGFLDLETRANVAVRQVAAANAVQLIDVAQQMPRGPRYFADFVHFSDAGAARMADLIAAALAASPAALPAGGGQ